MEPSSYTSIALYNIGAIIMERSASVGVSAVEERKAETFLEKAAQHWNHQQLNTTARVPPRIYNRLISLYLKSSPNGAPDLNLAVSQDNLTRAGAIITRYHSLFSRSSNWMNSTFYLGKTDYCIRSRNIDVVGRNYHLFSMLEISRSSKRRGTETLVSKAFITRTSPSYLYCRFYFYLCFY